MFFIYELMTKQHLAWLRQQGINKVPKITFYFWIIKILCTTVGETAADFLNVNLNLGLTGTSIVTGTSLIVALIAQFKTKKYIPAVYWIAVMLISVFGTLVTDNLTDAMGIPLETSTIVFSILLGMTFLIWYLFEKTLSIHSVFTMQRESFYWLAILFTFALGTAAGDLMAEGLGLGYAITGIIIAALIAIFSALWRLGLNSILSFWLIYILTRPLGASLGDYLSQSPAHGGLGLGATITSLVFFGGILGIVTYLSIAKSDTVDESYQERKKEDAQKGGLWQTIVVLAILFVIAGVGYYIRQSSLGNTEILQNETNTSSSEVATLGDLSIFRTIAQNTLDLLDAGKQSEATKRVSDLEYEWDNAEARLKPINKAQWREIDDKIDTVLRELRALRPDASTEKKALEDLLTVITS